MNKLLLSACALAASFSMMAADVTLTVATDATNIQGTLVEERPAGTNGDNDNGAAKHYQPLQSLEMGGYNFTFAKNDAGSDPALYYSMSTAATQTVNVRLYKAGSGKTNGNSMTIAAPAGTTFGTLTFKGKNGTANNVPTASVGSVKMNTASEMVWTNSEAVSQVTITLNSAAFYFTEVTVSTATGNVEQPEEPVTPTDAEFTQVTALENGKYIFVVDMEGAYKYGAPEAAEKTYGRMSLTDVTPAANGTITAPLSAAYDIEVVDTKVTIKDSYGRYYGMDTSHFTSFQFYTEVNEGCYYTFGLEGNAFKLTNALNPTCFVAVSQGNQGTFYTNIAPANAPEVFILPMLYKTNSASITNVAADTDLDAPAVYYNLQGQRVANPANGVFVKVQGSRAVKVIL